METKTWTQHKEDFIVEVQKELHKRTGYSLDDLALGWSLTSLWCECISPKEVVDRMVKEEHLYEIAH